MNILDQIIERKREEVELKKQLYSTKLLESSIYFKSKCVSLTEYLRRENSTGIIAEFKRKSPSKGVINSAADVESISIGYMQSAAAALSVLTDGEGFGGSLEDLQTARKYNFCPILRKDFIIDKYQIIESRSNGADVILLIAAALNEEQCAKLAAFARSLGLEVLLEIHEESELRFINQDISLVGVNNRNLKTFEVSIENSLSLIELLPKELPCISESGIHSAKDLVKLREAGYEGFLMGERFMKYVNPPAELRKFINDVRAIEHNTLVYAD